VALIAARAAAAPMAAAAVVRIASITWSLVALQNHFVATAGT
jgi:hypothetical protein